MNIMHTKPTQEVQKTTGGVRNKWINKNNISRSSRNLITKLSGNDQGMYRLILDYIGCPYITYMKKYFF